MGWETGLAADKRLEEVNRFCDHSVSEARLSACALAACGRHVSALLGPL